MQQVSQTKEIHIQQKTSTITSQYHETMAKVFCITPNRIKRTNGMELTPEMSVVVSLVKHTNAPLEPKGFKYPISVYTTSISKRLALTNPTSSL